MHNAQMKIYGTNISYVILNTSGQGQINIKKSDGGENCQASISPGSTGLIRKSLKLEKIK
jgi:hypothetical protein